MAYEISNDCISCGACVDECLNIAFMRGMTNISLMLKNALNVAAVLMYVL